MNRTAAKALNHQVESMMPKLEPVMTAAIPSIPYDKAMPLP